MPNDWRTTLGVLVATSGAAFAQQPMRFDPATSANIAIFCGAEGYEASNQYASWLSASLNQAGANGIRERDALAALEAFHCQPAMWADMTSEEAVQFCGDGELAPPYSARLNEVLERARRGGLEAPEAIAVIRSAHCHDSIN